MLAQFLAQEEANFRRFQYLEMLNSEVQNLHKESSEFRREAVMKGVCAASDTCSGVDRERSGEGIRALEDRVVQY